MGTAPVRHRPEATHALLDRHGGVPAGRYRPSVHVTLWNPVEVR